ncbi:uncharacterized protein LOC121232506 [Aquila chrysaetos chrysaetos]|uniref:uncharacterized protein LOC121232506 n=1 Tax=Aquila chrysaetos chrysaetos TaxID=223781 RepID=UPI001B7D4142|nr:uncharacterized protein LOC121232506 [Aquila chrysaetos chrysaetos]
MATIPVQIEAPSAATEMLVALLCAHVVKRPPLTLLSNRPWWIRLQHLCPTFWKTLSPYSGSSIKKKTKPNKQLDACSRCCFYKHTHMRVWPQRAKPYNLNEMAEVPPFSSGLDFGTSRNFMLPLVKILNKRPCLALFLSAGCLSSWSCRVAWRRVPWGWGGGVVAVSLADLKRSGQVLIAVCVLVPWVSARRFSSHLFPATCIGPSMDD